MPDERGDLTPEEKEKAIRWIEEHWQGSRECPISGHTTWELASHIVTPLPRVPGRIMLGGVTYPQIQLICNGCGYTMTFNALVMGLVERTADQEVKNG